VLSCRHHANQPVTARTYAHTQPNAQNPNFSYYIAPVQTEPLWSRFRTRPTDFAGRSQGIHRSNIRSRRLSLPYLVLLKWKMKKIK